MNQINDTQNKFTPAPSPRLKTREANQVPERKGNVQGSSGDIQIDADYSRVGGDSTAKRDALHAKPKYDAYQSIAKAQEGEVIDSAQVPVNLKDNGDSTQNVTDEKNPEENEIKEVTKKYRLTPKFNKWHELYLNKRSKETYMNATKSAIAAYDLDPETQYHVASQMGYKNLRKVEHLALRIAEDNDWSMEKFMQVGWLNALKSESPEWWDRMGDMVGYRSMKPQIQVTQNTQINTIMEVPAGEQATFNDQFRNFIKAR